MHNELLRYARGDQMTPLSDRKTAKEAKAIYDRTRLVAFTADGQLAVAGHIMKGLRDLNDHRVELAGNDAGLNMLLSEVMAHAVSQVMATQEQIGEGWRL